MAESLDHITTQIREAKILWSTDKRLAHQFRTRKEATGAAKKLGFPAKSPMQIDIMGFRLWALADDHCRTVNSGAIPLGWRQGRQ